MRKCGKATEVYSRVTGYFRPVKNWNAGKREEFRNRLYFGGPDRRRSQEEQGAWCLLENHASVGNEECLCS